MIQCLSTSKELPTSTPREHQMQIRRPEKIDGF